MNILEAKQIEDQAKDARDTWTTAWLAALQSPRYRQVEQRVVRQLLQALIYEGVVPCEYARAGQFLVEGSDPQGRAVQYRCPGEMKTSFGLVKLDRGPVLRAARDEDARPATLADVCAEVLGRLPPSDRLAAFIDELEQTLAKDLQAHSQPAGASGPAAQRAYDELEGDIMDAHLYHPSYKSRIGFSLDDNRRYGPEFKQPLALHWLAVHQRAARMNHSTRLDYRQLIQAELGDAEYARFAALLAQQGKDIGEYLLLPVHPWQWQQRIATLFHAELADGSVVWLGTGSDSYRPQQSIRTLANHSAPEKAYVKLSLSITNTSTSRILAAHTVMNGPIVTDWLHRLIGSDPTARELDFVILGEVLGVSFNYDTLPEPRKARAYGTLGAIWRESLHGYLRDGEAAVPFNGLCHVDDTGNPLIAPWIERHGVHAWTERLLHVAVTPIIHMLFAHGIGMESHAQNIVLIHQDGWPARIALKDFHDGVRYSPAHLAQPELAPNLVPVPATHARINRNSFILTDDLDAVRDFSCDAFFFICMAETAIFLARHHGLPETEFWAMTAKLIRQYQQRHPQHAERYAAFDVFAPTFQVEELTKRRLLGDAEPRFRQVPNPLHAFRDVAC
ncbi:siderophore synthetase component [Pseudoduganella flava]|uniref:IucA/IucC family siderophore biosynthesis protein n=1 Tax=Pseudoduganella flava TaxID=871742 RepID=A0A562Q0Z3_9BURK|nr:IucA/IucC family protein [Pseudoduganella flava]QGZ38144.1 IucA/IucC family siderophore biosynthesis protein [Pseudoduganella flava]TWI50337.1 siderophore synthetase component [Pseudoduganella flava]